MNEEHQDSKACSDATKPSHALLGVHEEPALASLIDVDSDASPIIAEPLTPTNRKPLSLDLAEKLHVNETSAPVHSQHKSDLVSGACPRDPLPTIDEQETLQFDKETKSSPNNQVQCDSLQSELEKIKTENCSLARELADLKSRLQLNKEELEREVQKRVELEQRFTEEAKRTTDQIEELIAKCESDDSKVNELKSRFELYARETSSMIESFTTNRELLASQLLEMRKENDHLLGHYLSKARDLQSAEINLPQTVEELQFHCLTLNEKLILSTMAKERLEEAMITSSSGTTVVIPGAPAAPTTS